MSTNTALDDIKARVEGHTEGPWEVSGIDSGHSRYETSLYVIAGDANDTICDMDGLTRATVNERVARDDGLADAELIAAAPKLLAALAAVEAELALAERTFSGFADEDLMVRGVCVSIHNAIEEALR